MSRPNESANSQYLRVLREMCSVMEKRNEALHWQVASLTLDQDARNLALAAIADERQEVDETCHALEMMLWRNVAK